MPADRSRAGYRKTGVGPLTLVLFGKMHNFAVSGLSKLQLKGPWSSPKAPTQLAIEHKDYLPELS